MEVSREDLLAQLRLSKELRRRFEVKLSVAEQIRQLEPEQARSSARHLLLEARGDFMELSALQDAVDGGFALPSYDHFKMRLLPKEE